MILNDSAAAPPPSQPKSSGVGGLFGSDDDEEDDMFFTPTKSIPKLDTATPSTAPSTLTQDQKAALRYIR